MERKICAECNKWLSRDFSADEIHAALSDLDPSKAPGLDGFPSHFYKKIWNEVGNDVLEVCLNILNNDAPFHATIIALIPKIGDEEVGLCEFSVFTEKYRKGNELQVYIQAMVGGKVC
ncbi:hypothetical protein POM88_036258 [Heracleum sosnowskyi]|uniref:Uncharacterized protein n=1 Tax=Heracleum sosnowskyi TaxID=360622 RepID=A0AAD8HNY7_9APIA|nr:hypothetical protein POM88_036258 [Heracleum sosnowskyi]